MSKPGRHARTPSDEIARFTDREDLQEIFRRYSYSSTEPPVLMFYGMGGAGKSWLLKKLRLQMPSDIPQAFLDFDTTAGGRRFILDPAVALYDIRHQLQKPAPRFDLAFAMMRHKQGVADEPGFLLDVASELAGGFFPGAGSVLKQLSKPLLMRLKGTQLEHFLANAAGKQLVLELRAKTNQEIGNQLLEYLAEDLRASLIARLNRAVSAVLFFDTFEAVSAGLQNEEHQRQHEKWVQDLAANLESVLVVIAGQNRLAWDEADPDWAQHLEQHLVGGLSEKDARSYLTQCEIKGQGIQDAILATSLDARGGYHCFSLGLCADIVYAERERGQESSAASLRFRPQDWEKLARRFLKSLASDAERRWIERLALTPKFDEGAAREAFSHEHSAAQDAAWEDLHDYSFVDRLPGSDGWSSVRSQMRWALENQPSAGGRVQQDHDWWQKYWAGRSASSVDQAASLAWYHEYCLAPGNTLKKWNQMAEMARKSVPPRMKEHNDLLGWWEPVGLLDALTPSLENARALASLGSELWETTLGSRIANLRHSVECLQAALKVFTEEKFPEDWAKAQDDLGVDWAAMPVGDKVENQREAMKCYEAALRIYIEQKYPEDWAKTQNNLGVAWAEVLAGDRRANLQRAIDYFEAALRVRTEDKYPAEWAKMQNNLGVAWAEMPSGDHTANLQRAIEYNEAALRVRTEQKYPVDWASTQSNLAGIWYGMPGGNREITLRRVIEHYEAALRVRTEQEFPADWAKTQNGLGNAWFGMPTGDRATNLRQASTCYEAALRVYTEQEYPSDWAMTLSNLAVATAEIPTGDRVEHLRQAIRYYEAVLRVYTAKESPTNWAETYNGLGNAWCDMPGGNREANLKQALACYETALNVYTKEKYPAEWGRTQICIGIAWWGMPLGDSEMNLRQAKDYYEAALQVCTEKELPADWSAAQYNLGLALLAMLSGDRQVNLQRAMGYFDAALRVYTEKESPTTWAGSKYSQGAIWLELQAGDRETNLRHAIECFEAALQVYTEKEFPVDWATTQNKLGNVWRVLSTGNRETNLRHAITCYEAALRARPEENFPQEWAKTQNDLGRAWFEMPAGHRAANLCEAIEHYTAALRVFTEQDFPENYEIVYKNLQVARHELDQVKA